LSQDLSEVVKKIVQGPKPKSYFNPPRVGRKKQIYLDALDIIVEECHELGTPTKTISDFDAYDEIIGFISQLFNEKEIDVRSDLVRRSKQLRGIE